MQAVQRLTDDEVRRRCAAIFGVAADALASEPAEGLRRLVADAEAEAAAWAEMGFLSPAEAGAFDRLGTLPDPSPAPHKGRATDRNPSREGSPYPLISRHPWQNN